MPEELGALIVLQDLLAVAPVFHRLSQVLDLVQHLQDFLGGEVFRLKSSSLENDRRQK